MIEYVPEPMNAAEPQGPDPLLSRQRYHRLLLYAAFSMIIVAVIPLVVMTAINYYQYNEAFRKETIRPISHLVSNAKSSLEFFLSDRLAALSLTIRRESIDNLRVHTKLNRLLKDMKQTFGGFIDIGLLDSDGKQISYAGPYPLKGKDYKDQDWFHQVALRGSYISDVFKGFRNLPHFVIAVKYDAENDTSFVLRATIDTEAINNQILSLNIRRSMDIFLIDRRGVLQTPSRFFGDVLQRYPLSVPPFSSKAEVLATTTKEGMPLVVGYAYVKPSPFVVILASRADELKEDWISLRRELIVFLAISILLIMAVVIWGSRHMVNRIRASDIRRAATLHNMEYTNKMAAIGRLAAGIAHEINNPLAIINEKAGLLNDLLSLSDESPPKEKLSKQVQSILRSIERCSKITHRLLGFAKHMDVQREKINLDILLKEVFGFLEKEASYRSLRVNFHFPQEIPVLASDRGQLQQVFLNIFNNAFAAVEDGGQIDIAVEEPRDDMIAVSIADNGVGISEEDLERIFEPFFTKKKGAGTGLGLSITYGIVEKLGGQIIVKSKLGEGTCFTVRLPINR